MFLSPQAITLQTIASEKKTNGPWEIKPPAMKGKDQSLSEAASVVLSSKLVSGLLEEAKKMKGNNYQHENQSSIIGMYYLIFSHCLNIGLSPKIPSMC